MTTRSALRDEQRRHEGDRALRAVRHHDLRRRSSGGPRDRVMRGDRLAQRRVGRRRRNRSGRRGMRRSRPRRRRPPASPGQAEGLACCRSMHALRRRGSRPECCRRAGGSRFPTRGGSRCGRCRAGCGMRQPRWCGSRADARRARALRAAPCAGRAGCRGRAAARCPRSPRRRALGCATVRAGFSRVRAETRESIMEPLYRHWPLCTGPILRLD